MLKRITGIAFIVCLTGILVYNIIEINESAEPDNAAEGLKAGQEAPDFQLKTLEGDTLRLDDFRGKKVFINFWATWCGPCREEMPAMQAFQKDFEGEVVILAINALNTELDGRNKVSNFVTDHELTFPVLLDEEGKTMERYQVTHMPTTYFIGTDGRIQENPHRGAMDEKFMREMEKKLN